MPDAQQVCDFVDVRFLVTVGAQAERDVPLDGKMWKKSVILGYVSDVAPARFEVGDVTSVDADMPRLDFFKAAKALQKNRLARSRRAQQDEGFPLCSVDAQTAQLECSAAKSD